MKNKKGFTLVELLAVIAILAILVIIALPNVLKLFNEAKKKTFLTETRTIYKEATKKYINESVKGNTIRKITSSGTNKLDMTGEQLKYCILLDSKGNVTSIKVSNDDYYIEYKGNKIEELTLVDVKEGTIDISNCKIESVVPVNNCTYDGELVKGAEYINGQYTYRYMQEGDYDAYGCTWIDISDEGWGVILTDKNSTDPVTTKLCTSINGKPIVSMSDMFYKSQATSIDVSSFDTSNVTNMSDMFLSSNVTTINLSGFDTSRVINMRGMFGESAATTINLSGFDTSNVTDMSVMFDSSEATTLDLSSFDTSNVTNMFRMFSWSQATSIDLSSFDTSKVTTMGDMFFESQVTELDLSSFDTSNVTDMGSMFDNTNASTIYVGSGWNTSKVTWHDRIFEGAVNLVGGAGTVYDSKHGNISYAHIDEGLSNPGYFTYKAHN